MIQLTSASDRHKRNKNTLLSDVLNTSLAQVKTFAIKLKLAKQISRERNSLRHLSDYHLRDIGLSRDQINTEINRGFLDIPLSRYPFGSVQGGVRDPDTQIRRLPHD